MTSEKKLLITGGAGFIGSRLITYLLDQTQWSIVNLDKLSYAGAANTVARFADSPRHHFIRADICDHTALAAVFDLHRPWGILHLAAESHVDRSIDGPEVFVKSNVWGTFTLLEASLAYWRGLEGERKSAFRLHHISTDEVYGELGPHDPPFTESHPYAPRSPYSASKAASDHLVRAWHATYGLPVVLSNCSNNYGPFQFPEKLIPLVIRKAISGERIPVYGTGENVRDWLFVDDHTAALRLIFERGKTGETYNVGGGTELTNIDIVHRICIILDELRPDDPVLPHADLINFVRDRPGHDFRYAIDAKRLQDDLGWAPCTDFQTGLRTTVQWYLDNQRWCEQVSGVYTGERLGLNT